MLVPLIKILATQKTLFKSRIAVGSSVNITFK